MQSLLQELNGKIKRLLLLNKQQPNNRDSGIFDNIHDADEVIWAKSKLNRYMATYLYFAHYIYSLFYSFAMEVGRYRDPVQYSMMTELDCSPVTEHFAKKVRGPQ